MTARELIVNAYRVAGLIGQGQVPSGAETDDGLRELNYLLETWSNESLFKNGSTKYTGTLVVGQGSYTIGTGGNFNTPRPESIISLGVLIPTGYFKPLEWIETVDWDNACRNTQLTGEPAFYTYSLQYPLGEVRIYPAPSDADSVEIQYKPSVGGYDFNDQMAMPPGYEGAIQYGLAAVLAGMAGLDNSRLEMVANERKTRIERMNYTTRSLDLDCATGGRVNIKTVEY
jgi:hypothetical protein